jgi:hypothetical protein
VIHLSSDELVDAAEGTLGPDRRAHLAECAACAGEIERLRLTLGEARSATAPEPSPMFWDHFSARVRRRIASEALPSSPWSDWFRWPVVAPIAALVALVLGLAALMPRERVEPATVAVVTAPENAIDVASVGEQAWAMVSETVGPLDLDAAHEAGLVRLGDAERAALTLSDAERRELLRLLQQEMEKAGS